MVSTNWGKVTPNSTNYGGKVAPGSTSWTPSNPIITDYLLLETGSFILQENGSKLIYDE